MKHSEILDDVTLYDVMYEAGTRLGGAMSKLRTMDMSRGDENGASKWLAAQEELQSERQAIDPHDRQAMIAAYDKWNALEHEYYRLIIEQDS